MKKKKNRGFSLVEMVVVVSIFAILLGVLIPSLNSLLGFEAQRATGSIAAALDKTKIEAMSRLVGEMKLEYAQDGYYVTYYLDRGKGQGLTKGEQPEQVARRKVLISYVDSNNITHDLKAGGSLILTFDRETGGFRMIQSDTITTEEMTAFLDEDEDSYQDLAFKDDAAQGYCTAIIVTCGMRSRRITLNQYTGSYTIRAV